MTLSELLNEYGLQSSALQSIRGDFPDVFLIVRGLRVVIETKDIRLRAQLHEQLKDRLRVNMCELALGITFPSSVLEGSPTPNIVSQRLRSSHLTAFAYAMRAAGPHLILAEEDVTVAGLPELLPQLAGQAVPESEIDAAVAQVRQALQGFNREILGMPSAENIASQIKRVLNLGE